MKILCLHGKGTSGSIFRSQTCNSPMHTPSSYKSEGLKHNSTASFRARLSSQNINIHFDFLDGFHEDNPAAGVDLFYPPPYYSWYESDGVEPVRTACNRLNEYIAKNGPYDAALMFSQGCVLGSSMLLFHQEEAPHLPPPFKAGIFVCGGASFSVLEEMGFHVSAAARERDLASRSALMAQAGSSAVLSQGSSRWMGMGSLDGGLSDEDLRGEISSPFRIDVPTVHVYGSKDPRYAAGVHLSGICEPAKRRVFDHGGGHEIPRNEAVSTEIAELVQWALAQADDSP